MGFWPPNRGCHARFTSARRVKSNRSTRKHSRSVCSFETLEPRMVLTAAPSDLIAVWSNDASVLGDYNLDGVADLADYTVWRNNLGDTVTPGTGADGSGDGTTDVGIKPLHYAF